MKTSRAASCVVAYVPLWALLPVAAHAATQTVPDRLDLYSRAAGAITDAKPPVDPATDGETLSDPEVRAERYSLARREAWLKSNAKGFALFQQALRAPVGPEPSVSAPAKVLMGQYGDLRQLARYKLIEANTRELRRDWNGALQSHLDVVQLGNDVGQGGGLISALTGHAIIALGRDGVWELSERLNLAQAKAATVRLQGLYLGRLLLTGTIGAEKQSGLKMLRGMMLDPKWRAPELWGVTESAQREDLLKVTPEEVLVRYAQKMDAQTANALLPYRTLVLQPRRAQKTFDDLLVPDLRSYAFTFARTDSAMAAWLVVLALHVHKLERGAYPQTLNALVPRYLNRVPVDPFSAAAPLRYRRTAKSYVLWSIGPDGLDNGGQAVQWARPRILYPGAKPLLPFVSTDSKGDFVAGKNR